MTAYRAVQSDPDILEEATQQEGTWFPEIASFSSPLQLTLFQCPESSPTNQCHSKCPWEEESGQPSPQLQFQLKDAVKRSVNSTPCRTAERFSRIKLPDVCQR